MISGYQVGQTYEWLYNGVAEETFTVTRIVDDQGIRIVRAYVGNDREREFRYATDNEWHWKHSRLVADDPADFEFDI